MPLQRSGVNFSPTQSASDADSAGEKSSKQEGHTRPLPLAKLSPYAEAAACSGINPRDSRYSISFCADCSAVSLSVSQVTSGLSGAS